MSKQCWLKNIFLNVFGLSIHFVQIPDEDYDYLADQIALQRFFLFSVHFSSLTPNKFKMAGSLEISLEEAGVKPWTSESKGDSEICKTATKPQSRH